MTLKWNRVERMAIEAMVLISNPPDHHNVGTRSSIGVWSSSSGSSSLLLNQLRQSIDPPLFTAAARGVEFRDLGVQGYGCLPIKGGRTLRMRSVKEYNIMTKTPGQSNQ